MSENKLDYPDAHLLPEIYNYISYREYLIDFVKTLRLHNKKRNSFRRINEVLGTGNDHGYIQKLLGLNEECNSKSSTRNTVKNITDTFIMRFSNDLLHLDNEKNEYFITMVRYEQTTLETEKNKLYQELCRLNDSAPTLITPDEYKLFRSWYMLALRVILDVVDYPAGGETVASIGEKMNPPISETKVTEAIGLLLKTGMIAEDDNGNYRPTDKRITTGTDADAKIIKDWQHDYFKIALKTFHQTGTLKPSYWTNTISCSRSCIDQIETLTKDFIKQIDLLVCSEKKKPEVVYHMNLQVFPLLKEKPLC